MGSMFSALSLAPITLVILLRHLHEYLRWSKVLRKLPAAHLVYPRRANRQLAARLYSTVPSIAVAPEVSTRKDACLHIFVHGTLSTPFYHTDILKASVESNNHYTLGLSYPYSFFSSQKLGRKYLKTFSKEDLGAAYAAFYERIAFGGVATKLHPQISSEDSITGRVKSAILWLAKQYPDEGWDKFVQDGEVVWSRVILSGHSQGGSHATYIAQKVALRKAVLISAPQGVPNVSESFLKEEFATKDVVALSHSKEDGIVSIKEGLSLMDPDAEFVELDESFEGDVTQGSKYFLSNVQPKSNVLPRKHHMSTATDVAARPVYAKVVWPMLLRT